jgi:prevent-host-death family protein
MCYMSDETPGPERVGVRELRQNLSVYLDRVKEGETLEVTEHGHAVALLTPLPRVAVSTLERLIAEGRVTPGSGDLMAYLRTTRPPGGGQSGEPSAGRRPSTATASSTPPREPTMAEILQQMQEEGRS